MVVFRPIALSDLDGLYGLACEAGYGLTTLPSDREILRERILDSVHGFEKISGKPGAEIYLFVLEDLESGEIIGASGLSSKVGGYIPFYTYKIRSEHIASTQLGVEKDVRMLELVEDHNGPSEIGSLYLAKGGRGSGYGKLLSLSRFLFVADFRSYFDGYMIAEMRGEIDSQGKSPFWESLGRHFFCTELHEADSFTMVSKQFIADLMPKHPIYIDLLPEAAQRVIGRVHEKTLPARQILEGQGFEFAGEVDIFEAGPTLRCLVDEIKAVKESRVGVVRELVDAAGGECLWIVSNGLRDFRAGLGGLEILEGEGVSLERELGEALGVGVGDRVRFYLVSDPLGSQKIKE